MINCEKMKPYVGLLLRMGLGVIFLYHGYHKVFGAETVGPKAISNGDYDYQLPAFSRVGVRVNGQYQFVVSGEGQPITEFELSSRTGAIVPAPGDDASPFGSLSSNTWTRVTFLPASDALTLEGEVTLGIAWDPTGREDVVVSYDLLGDIQDDAFTIPAENYPKVPEYTKFGVDPILITLDDQNRFVITGTGQQVNGIEFISAAGAYGPGLRPGCAAREVQSGAGQAAPCGRQRPVPGSQGRPCPVPGRSPCRARVHAGSPDRRGRRRDHRRWFQWTPGGRTSARCRGREPPGDRDGR